MYEFAGGEKIAVRIGLSDFHFSDRESSLRFS